MGLIIDTGIVLDIVALYPNGTLRDIMLSWVTGVVNNIAPPAPRGKFVTMFISPGVYRDYGARVSKNVDTSYSSWRVLRKFVAQKYISRQNQLSFIFQPLSTDKVDTSAWRGDRYDRPFFALLETVRQNPAWADRMIIFASKDRDSIGRMRDLMALRDTDRQVHFADTLSACEELVMC